MPSVTKDMLIGEVVQNFPDAVDVMLSHGFHCVGCHVSPFETIEQGAKGHGFTDEAVTQLMEDINSKVSNSPIVIKPEELPAHLTEAAATKLKSLMTAEGKAGMGLRISLQGGGCAGNSYEMDFDQPDPQNDRIFESHGLKLFYNNEFHDQIKGIEIHYRDALNGGGFTMRNPNAQASCGCGKSFS
ncbi:iron-sulfur cluster assembly accessory protein [Candidatus Micrarchaeota archaeon]|nr:iron-sulfur cluster assembly accessory protein [Candidatus Micrarchaeota archaeon]